MFAGRLNLLQVADVRYFFRILHFLFEHFAVADDGIERRPQFMTHVGEEGALGAVRLLCSLFGGQ